MALKNATQKVQTSNKERQKTDKELFIEEMTPYANDAAAELGIDPKILLAQAGHETGWGKHVAKNSDGSTSYNLFNIKTTKGWKGDSTRITTHEIENGKSVKQKASFRSYSSYKESFQDYTKFIKENKRYSKAVEAGRKGDSTGYVKELAKAGYATDTTYSDKVLKTAAGIGAGVLVGAGVAKSATMATAIAKGTSKAVTTTSSIASKVITSAKSVFKTPTESIKEEPEKSETKQTSITIPKSKKKIAYETHDLNSWQKQVIILLTDWANSKRIIKEENKSDTISINQALNEREETETIQIQQEKPSLAKSIAKGILGTSAIMAIPTIANVVSPEIKQRNKISNNKIEKPKELKINASPLPKKELPKAEVKADKPTVQEKFTKIVNNTVEKINKPVIKDDIKTVSTVVAKQTVIKEIPKQKENKNKQRTIIISNTDNKEIDNSSSKVFLFGDRYNALDDIKNISLSSRDYGTGLFYKQ